LFFFHPVHHLRHRGKLAIHAAAQFGNNRLAEPAGAGGPLQVFRQHFRLNSARRQCNHPREKRISVIALRAAHDLVDYVVGAGGVQLFSDNGIGVSPRHRISGTLGPDREKLLGYDLRNLRLAPFGRGKLKPPQVVDAALLVRTPRLLQEIA
jgi:hypothetical protein